MTELASEKYPECTKFVLEGGKWYPECTKMATVAPDSQKIGEFLEWWMSGEGRILGEGYKDYGDLRAWFPTHKTIEVILAEYFEIDLKKVEVEKQRMLDEIRREHASKGLDGTKLETN